MDNTDEFLSTIDYGIRQKERERAKIKSENKKVLEQKKTTSQYQIEKLSQKQKINLAKEQARKKLNIPVQEAISKYNKKIQLRNAKLEIERLRRGNIPNTLNQASIQQIQANRRSNIIGNLYSKAEQLELWAVNLDEQPLLYAMEKERGRLATPNDRAFSNLIRNAQNICTPNNLNLKNFEKSVTDSLPD
jgi:hypothetical protein